MIIFNRHTSWITAFLTLAVTFLCSNLLRTGNSTPCRAETPFFGFENAVTTNYTEVVEDQDDSTRISGVWYCVMYDGSGVK